MSKKNILVIFDIDETLLQFINIPAYHYWEEITPIQKCIIQNKLEFIDYGKEKRKVIFFRPGLREFFNMVQEYNSKNKNKIKIALWTYSEQEYAEDIAEILCSYYKIPKDIFIFKYGAEQIDDEIPKSMQTIWDKDKWHNEFNKFNTFLVDDKFNNLCHQSLNSIHIQPFAPFGDTKPREPLTYKFLINSIKDNVFKNLIKIIKIVLEDITGCSDKEVNEAFSSEEIFSPKCMKRRNLTEYVKKHAKGIEICSLGNNIEGGTVKRKRSTKRASKRASKRGSKRASKRASKKAANRVIRASKRAAKRATKRAAKI